MMKRAAPVLKNAIVAGRVRTCASMSKLPQALTFQATQGRSFSVTRMVPTKVTEPTKGPYNMESAEQIEMAMNKKTHEQLLQDSEKQFRKVAKGQDEKFLDPKDVKEFVVAEIKRNDSSYSRSDATMAYVLSKVDQCLEEADKNHDGKIELHEFFDLWRRLSMVQLEGIRSSTGVDLRAALESMIDQRPKQ